MATHMATFGTFRGAPKPFAAPNAETGRLYMVRRVRLVAVDRGEFRALEDELDLVVDA